MSRWLIYSISLCISVSTSFAQLNPVRTAAKRLQDGKWERSHRLLQKVLRKDSTDVEGNFVTANWFLAQRNPEFQLDSADRYARKTITYYYLVESRDREKLQRVPIDSLILQSLREKIDSLAFQHAKLINTEGSYNRFINSFPNALQHEMAIELRDEVSFLEALKMNTYSSFDDYLNRYPASHRAQEAKERYEKLLFDERTKDKKLASYKLFLTRYPSSPYAAKAEREIFELTTANGEPETFFQYLREYPKGHYAKFARDLVYHLFKETDEKIPSIIETDSLRDVIKVSSKFWIPFYKNELYGFMDQDGKETLAPRFEEIEEEYKCGAINDDIVTFKSGVFSRTGKKLAEPDTKITSIGWGFLMAEAKSCRWLIHKSGAVLISDCYDDFEIVGNNFIAAISNKQWKLFTLTGRLLNIDGVTEVKEIEGIIVLTRFGKKILTTAQQLSGLVNGIELNEELVFDDVQAMSKGLLLARNGSLEGIINSQLKFIVPLDRHVLTKTSFGLIEKLPTGTKVHGLSAELENQNWHRVYYHRDWLVLTREGRLQLFNVSTKKMVLMKADTIWFDRSLAFVQTNQATKVYLTANHSIDLQPDSKISFINARDSVQFFFTDSKNKRTVFSVASGDQLFNTEYELTETIGADFFIVSKGNRKGVLGRNGKVVVPVEMDAIIQTPAGQLSLLKDKKFGLFDLASRRLIKPVYERNVTLLNRNHLIVYKDGFFGLIGWDSKPITKFEFAEVVPWSDKVIWIKKNFQWLLINYETEEVILDRIRDFSWLRNSAEEKLVRVHRENYYGVISNRKGLIIAPTFHDLINLGTEEIPFYFTEKSVEEAGIYVVIYYDHTGKLVRRQAYEEEEYDRIVCNAH
ncbi:MAG: hypothetical protein JNM78_03665 [Cyclobacteriaceae bacterium]|nr:hypothetical protein [Cyclobacteriaceae bacterium]